MEDITPNSLKVEQKFIDDKVPSITVRTKESWSYDEVCSLLHMLYSDTNCNINWHGSNPINEWIDNHVQTEI